MEEQPSLFKSQKTKPSPKKKITHRSPPEPKIESDSYEECLDRAYNSLSDPKLAPLKECRKALRIHPADITLLCLTAYAAIFETNPDVALEYLKRLQKRYKIDTTMDLCRAIALAQQNKWPQAKSHLDRFNDNLEKYDNSSEGTSYQPNSLPVNWVKTWKQRIMHWEPEIQPKKQEKKKNKLRNNKTLKNDEAPPEKPIASLTPPAAELQTSIQLPAHEQFSLMNKSDSGLKDFCLRLDFTRIRLLKGFDELLCISRMKTVREMRHQVETVRKVLRQFRGRVLLADEVGLGKTIEAGMLLKEYSLRGMAEKILILTPAALVSQWRDEMNEKFELDFAVVDDVGGASEEIWDYPRIIVSIAMARRANHFQIAADHEFDIVVVDEAHHLKNRRTKNWQLVDALKKRFLLLLSATPVQNNLVELYNLLTLLKPGIFNTEKEFRARYMVPGKPRTPANRAELRELMRAVMIRNTRAMVDVRLPSRQVVTLRAKPSVQERDCYAELNRLIRNLENQEVVKKRLVLQHLLMAAGSSALVVSESMERFLGPKPPPEWKTLLTSYKNITHCAKMDTLIQLLEKNRSEKKIIFARKRATLHLLEEVLNERGIVTSRFDGSLSAAEKDRSVEEFRQRGEVLLSSESGGEGRNLQFCNTLINFDLPWNPQQIEQRIGRIHRIGQEREVYVFNLTLAYTLEDRLLAVLDEKINMFELVVGEIQSILGELEEGQNFVSLVFDSWLAASRERESEALEKLGGDILQAKKKLDDASVLDHHLFGEDFEAS